MSARYESRTTTVPVNVVFGLRVQSSDAAREFVAPMRGGHMHTGTGVPCHLVVRVVMHAFDDVDLTRLRVRQAMLYRSNSSYSRKATALHRVSTKQAIHL